MNTIKHRLIRALPVLLIGFLLSAGVGYALDALYVISNTTLNGAITATATSLVLTSATATSDSSFGNPAAGQCLFVDKELMNITAMSSTTATVRRSVSGASPHANLATIFTAPCANFKQTDPPFGGNVTCLTFPMPWITVTNGNIWTCGSVGGAAKITATNAAAITYNSVQARP